MRYTGRISGLRAAGAAFVLGVVACVALGWSLDTVAAWIAAYLFGGLLLAISGGVVAFVAHAPRPCALKDNGARHCDDL